MLEIQDITKNYENKPLLRGVSFTVAAGETVCLLGTSGSGKSTLLRIIAGLETPQAGTVRWDGEDLASTPAHRRNFGLMFQDYALFPHLSVAENVAFGLKMQNLPRGELDRRVNESLAKVNLSGFDQRRVTDLSGGEQQRVALARALAPDPRLLMFDEPLGALDRTLRTSLLEELRRLLRLSRVPAIYVTHDQEEAFAIADRVLILHDGQILRDGTPAQVWAEPGSVWAAKFLGAGNVVEGIVKIERRGAGRIVVETKFGMLEAVCAWKVKAGESVSLLIRPQATITPGSRNTISGRLTDMVFQQDRYKVTLDNGLVFYLPEAPQVGKEIRLEIPPSAIQCLP